MARSLTINDQHLETVKRVLQYKQFSSQRAIAGELGVAISTVSRFFTGKPVDYSIFVQLCDALDLDWQAIANHDLERDVPLVQNSVLTSISSQDLSSHSIIRDWDGAMNVSVFFGRSKELATLKRWILVDNCRLVTLLGMGGIGKTSLAVKLAQSIQTNFDALIWRSLRNAPPVIDTLAELIRVLSHQSDVNEFKTVDQGIAHLVSHLRNKRCLLILDNVESILQGSSEDRVRHSGRYRPGYEGYGQLFKIIGGAAHTSCLILTSREQPHGLAARAGATLPIRDLQLVGLPISTGQELIAAKGKVNGSDADWQKLNVHYAGNPLALKIVASFICEFFEGNLTQFLAFLTRSPFIFDDIRDLLEQQWQRLSRLEQATMYWLAINREPVSLSELLTDFISPISPGELLQAIASLQNRSLIEKVDGAFTQQPVVMEYVINCLVERIYLEITTLGNHLPQESSSSSSFALYSDSLAHHSLLHTHALIKTNVKDYIRGAQTQLVLDRVAQRLLPCLSSQNPTQLIQSILHVLRANPVLATGYAAGNLLNLSCHLNLDLSTCDFSYLTLRQTYLQGITLPQANFAHAEFINAIFTQTFGNIITIAFSPDGTQLATGDSNNEVWLWRISDGQPLISLKGHSSWIISVAFSPDGKTLASGSGDYTIRLWDIRSGQCLRILQGHQSVVHWVAFSPNNQIIASGSNDQTVKLWSTNTGECCQTLTVKGGRVRAVAFSCDGKTLASGHADSVVRLWDISTGECLTRFEGHTAAIWSVDFSSDGQTLASTGIDQTIRLWDISSGQCLSVLKEHHGQVCSVQFSPDGQTLASGSRDQTVRVWSVSERKCLATLTGHTNQVWAVAFDPNGQFLASGGLGQTVHFWDLQTKQRLNTWHGHTNCIRTLAFAPTGNILVSGGDDTVVHVWDVQISNCTQNFEGHRDGIWTSALSPDGQTLVTGGFDQTFQFWNLQSDSPSVTLDNNASWVHSIAFHPEGQIFASGHLQPVIHIWNCYTKQCIKILEGHTDRVWSVAFSPDGQFLASSGADTTVRLWQVDTGECVQCFSDRTDWNYSVVFVPLEDTHSACSQPQKCSNYLLASAGADRNITLWDVQSGEYLRTLKGHTDWVYAIAAHPRGRLLASASFDHTARIWDVHTGECLHILPHSTPLWSIAFHPEGHTLACGCGDETIVLWHVETGDRLKTLRLPKPYEAMNITGVKGLTIAQKETLKALGAVERL